MPRVRTWSATPYCGEADILEIRLATLAEVVDHHVIVEGNRTQRGLPKPLWFPKQRERFQRWLSKITYIPVALDGEPGPQADWNRERGLRDVLAQGLEEVADDDLVLFSDVDEIPKPEFVCDYGEPHRLEMDMHMYFLNWRWPERPVRYGTRATLISGARMREGTPSRIVEAGWPLVDGTSGWHLAYQMDAKGMRDKILSIADDFRRPEFLDLEHLERCRRTGFDLFNRDFRRCDWAPDEDLPPYVLEQRERFAHMLLPQPAEIAA